MKLDSSAFQADPELLAALDARCAPMTCVQEKLLFRQGDAPTGLYILRRGQATLTMTSVTGDLLLDTPVNAGALLGLPGVIGNQPYSLTAVVAAGSELGFISVKDFSELMLKEPALALSVLRVLAAEVRTARTAITS